MNEQPNNETLIQSSSRDLQIIEDDAFSYEGYQVVRGEFFAHTYEPSFTFNANKVSVNTASYRIYGAINKKEGLASFSMQECILVDESVRIGEIV